MEGDTKEKSELPVVQFLATVHKDQSTLLYAIWGIFSTLSFALLGYVFASSQSKVAENPALLACFSFCVVAFAVGNHTAILRSQRLVHAATRDLNALAADHPHIEHTLKTFDAPDTTGLARSHIFFTVCVATGFWVPYFIKNSGWFARWSSLIA